jgi:hypothetical protein
MRAKTQTYFAQHLLEPGEAKSLAVDLQFHFGFIAFSAVINENFQVNHVVLLRRCTDLVKNYA